MGSKLDTAHQGTTHKDNSSSNKPFLPTLCLSAWEHELCEDEHKEFLLEGISQGFKITNSTAQPQKVKMDNYKSAILNKDLVEEQIKVEIAENRYVPMPQPAVITSAIGAIPKPGNGIRIIHDCSRPVNQSLNSFVQDKMSIKYQTVQDAVKLLKS